MRRRHTPQRTCIGCREAGDKRQLMRLLRTPEGKVEVDETNKRPGRGAYLHRCKTCWENALQKRLLERALRLDAPLTEENLDTLKAYAQTLSEKESS